MFLAVPGGSCHDCGMPALQDRTQSLQRLAALVIQCRAALGWSKEKAAAEAGVAYMTYSRVEEGKSVQAATYAKVERALNLVPGACRAVLDGARSITLQDGTEMVEGAKISRVPVELMEDEARQGVTTALIATAPDATAREIQAMSDQIVKELRKRGVLP